MNKIVHFHIFNPTKTIFKQSKREPADCSFITCSLESCNLRDEGQCMLIHTFGGNHCPYGKFSKEIGFTVKSIKFYEWINKQQEKYKGIPYLKTPGYKLAFVGDYVYVPYSHANFYMGMGGGIRGKTIRHSFS